MTTTTGSPGRRETTPIPSPPRLGQPPEADRAGPPSADICRRLQTIVRDEFGDHPFAEPTDHAGFEVLFPEYLGMSVAFRYLQAAAQKDAIFASICENRPVPEAIELMNVVGNFLSWDESGGIDLMLEQGKAGLPDILDPDRFHSGLFRADAARILGHAIEPHYSPATRTYLLALYDGLAATDVVVRCAHMVAFELHAGIMIDALWSVVASSTGLPPEELAYFERHVGGDDPAEQYHVQLTQQLIERVVEGPQHDRFLSEFRRAYALHTQWCRACKRQPAESATSPQSPERWHAGRCHCGGVQFEVRAPVTPRVVRCNCSICDMTGFLHLLVSKDRVRVLKGAGLLTEYKFNTAIATHTFCKRCGTRPFYRPRSNPDGFSVNVRCLDRSTIDDVEIRDFDGAHWEDSIASLRSTSEYDGSGPSTATRGLSLV